MKINNKRYIKDQNFFNLLTIIRTVTKQTAKVAIDTIFCFDISALGNLAVPLSTSLFSSTR